MPKQKNEWRLLHALDTHAILVNKDGGKMLVPYRSILNVLVSDDADSIQIGWTSGFGGTPADTTPLNADLLHDQLELYWRREMNHV